MISIDIFPWDENFNTGIAIIDKQHKKLVALLNSLASYVAFQAQVPILADILDELASYAIYHFETEEAVWHQYLPEDSLEIQHKALHQSFIDSILRLKAEKDTKNTDELIEEILAFLTRWLASHILESDRYLAKVVLKIQVGFNLEQAKIHANEQMGGSTRTLIDIILSIYNSLSMNTLYLMRELAQRKQEEALRLAEREQAEQQMAKSISLLTATLESITDAVLVVDRQGYWELYNQQFIDLWQIPDAIISSKNDNDALVYVLNQLEDADNFLKKIYELYASPQLRSFDILNFKNGRIIERYSIPQCVNNEIIGRVWSFRDITERKQTEIALAESRNLLKTIIDTAPMRIFWKDKKSHYLGCNPTFAHDAGFDSPQDIIGKDDYQLSWHEHAERYRGDDSDIIYANTPKLSYEDLRTINGEKAWIRTVKVPLHNTKNEIIGVLGIYHDITERKLLEQHLLAQLSFIQSVINAQVNALAVCHGINEPPYTQFTVWNHSMELLTGFTLEEINQLGWYQTVYIDSKVQEQAKQRMARMRQGDHIKGEEWTITRKNGEERVVQIYTTVCAHDSQGSHVLAVMHDITERKRVESALHKSHQHIYSLLNSMAEGAYGVDTKGYCRFANQSFLRILGYDSIEEVIGKHVHELIHHSYPDGSPYPVEDCKIYAAYVRNEKVHVSDEVFWRKDGQAVPVEYWSQPSIIDGIITGAIATFIDISERLKAQQALLKESEKNLMLLRNASDGIHILDTDGNILEVSDAFCDMLGYKREEMTGMNVSQWDAQYSDVELISLLKQYLEQDVRIQFETRHRHKDGDIFDVEVSSFPLQLDGKRVLFNSSRDITQRKHIEQQLRIAATVFESQEGMMVVDINQSILRVNQAFTDITGYSPEEVIGKNPRILQSGRHGQDFYAEVWVSINNTGRWQGELWNRRKNGELYPQYLHITAVKNQNGMISHYVGTLIDITLKKAADQEIERLAFYDPLTNLANRRLLQDRLKLALASSHRSGKQGALLFIDLDNFKSLNDTLGHDVGDLLLQQVAQRLLANNRETDTVARLGGDEFVVMLENLSHHALEAATQADTIADTILNDFNQPFHLTENLIHLNTASIGVTLFNGHLQTEDELLKHADIAMYQAKSAGRNTIRFFDPQMQKIITARVLLENELRAALKHWQFQLYYQIQVDNCYRPLGAEALIRWHHPQRGLLPPSEFIALAEDTGLILPIGDWVLETACKQLKAWQQNPLTRELVLSVNVSAKQFFQSNFVQRVQAIIECYAINPALLKLELTESMLLVNVEDTIAIMNTLRELDIQFSLDDFGTGYSSLQYLKKLPLHQLKIDQSFVRDISIDSSDQTIVRTIIVMATSLGLNVIAEGVETQEQLQFLLNNGCHHYQGYLFSEPLSINQFEILLEQVTVAIDYP
ncbi:MAG: bacteriohemerythrin [Methylococcaceae bacterium]